MRIVSRLLSVLACCLVLSPAAHAAPTSLKTAWLGEHEAFVVWYAREKGWDKEAGLDMTMLNFESGKAIVEGQLAYGWDIAGCGAVPALMAPLADRLSVIAVANDESAANAVYVRPDSPILKVRGANPEYPNLYGSAEGVKGKHFLCPRGTSAHYLLASWLKRLGLSEKDVRVQDIPSKTSLGAFTGGLGDGVALWAPHTYTAEAQGLKPAALSADCRISQPVLIVVNTEFAARNPQVVEAFLKMYLRGVDMLAGTPADALADDYIRFQQQWAGRTLTRETAMRDLADHPVFPLADQLALFDTSSGKSTLQQRLGDIVAFYQDIGAVRADDLPRLQRLHNVTDTYLKALR